MRASQAVVSALCAAVVALALVAQPALAGPARGPLGSFLSNTTLGSRLENLTASAQNLTSRLTTTTTRGAFGNRSAEMLSSLGSFRPLMNLTTLRTFNTTGSNSTLRGALLQGLASNITARASESPLAVTGLFTNTMGNLSSIFRAGVEDSADAPAGGLQSVIQGSIANLQDTLQRFQQSIAAQDNGLQATFCGLWYAFDMAQSQYKNLEQNNPLAFQLLSSTIGATLDSALGGLSPAAQGFLKRQCEPYVPATRAPGAGLQDFIASFFGQDTSLANYLASWASPLDEATKVTSGGDGSAASSSSTRPLATLLSQFQSATSRDTPAGAAAFTDFVNGVLSGFNGNNRAASSSSTSSDGASGAAADGAKPFSGLGAAVDSAVGMRSSANATPAGLTPEDTAAPVVVPK